MSKRNRQQWTKKIRSLHDVSYSPNVKNYPIKWYIYELASDSEANFTTQSEFASLALTSVTSEEKVLNITIKPATEFVDGNDGATGVLNVKEDFERRISSVSPADFFPKFIQKEPIDAWTYQQFNADNRVFFAMKQDPVTDATGKITYTDIYLLYDYKKVLDTKGNYKHSQVVFARIDSNLAKNELDEYLEINFYTKPTQPTNAESIVLVPSSFTAFPTGRPVELIEDDESDSTINFTEVDINTDLWDLGFFGFTVTGSSSIRINDYIWSEYQYKEKLSSMITNDNIEHSRSFYDILEDRSWDELEGDNNNDYYQKFSNYNTEEVTEIVGGGPGAFKDDYVNDYIKVWNIGGLDSALTQFNSYFSYESTEGSADQRRTKNWVNANKWFIFDIYHTHYQFGFTEGSRLEFTIKPSYNNINAQGNNPIDRDVFFSDVFNGIASLGGLDLSSSKFGTDGYIAATDFVSDLNTVSSTNGFCIINTLSLENRKYIYEDVDWVIDQVLIASTSLGAEPQSLRPNALSSLGVKGGLIKTNVINGSVSTNNVEETAIQLHFGEEKKIKQISIDWIGGDMTLAFLDKDGNYANGVYDDGGVLVNIPLTPSIISTPQAVNARIMRRTIIYI